MFGAAELIIAKLFYFVNHQFLKNGMNLWRVLIKVSFFVRLQANKKPWPIDQGDEGRKSTQKAQVDGKNALVYAD